MRYGTVILGLSAILAVWGVRPLGAQSIGLISGHARPQAGQPYTQHSVQARDIHTGEIVATSKLDENTAEYELASLPEGSFLVDLLDSDGGVLGVFNWSSQHLDDEVLRCRNGDGEG